MDLIMIIMMNLSKIDALWLSYVLEFNYYLLLVVISRSHVSGVIIITQVDVAAQ